MTRKASITPGTWVALLIFAPLLPAHAREDRIACSDGEYCETLIDDVHFFSVIQLGTAEFIEVNFPLRNFILATANSSVAVGQLHSYPPSILQWLDERRPTAKRSSLSLVGGIFLGAFAIAACCLCSGDNPKRRLLPWHLLPPVSGPSRSHRKAGEAMPGVEGVLDAAVGSSSTARKEAACCAGILPFMSSWSSSVDERPQCRNADMKTQAIKAQTTPHLSIMSVHGIIIDIDAGRQSASAAAMSESESHASAQLKKTGRYVRKVNTLCGVGSSLKRCSTEQGVPDFSGKWTCTDTWGLEDFLEEQGISKVQRSIASAASRPAWEFQQEKNHIKFKNRTMIGLLEEEFEVGGADFTALDGHGQSLKCSALWEGATLLIIRAGPQGKWTEERRIDESGTLHFQLRANAPGLTACWGRTFKRAS